MNRIILKKLIAKDFNEFRKKIILTIPGLIIVTLIFIFPFIVAPDKSDMEIVNKIFQIYSERYSNSFGPDISKIIMLDLKLPFLLLLPAFIAPLFFTIDCIINEKENRTLEALFVLPISDREILFGKMSMGLLWGILITWLIHIFYFLIFYFIISKTVALHLLSWKWIIVSVIVVPEAAFLSNTIGVLLSSTMKKIKTAQYLGMVTLLPVFILFLLIGNGLIFFSTKVLLSTLILIFIIDFIFFKITLKTFERERILLRY